jgi:Endonuclease/Exonuclease/phosphatase family
MRIASFNIENFFTRPKAMNHDTQAEGRAILEAHAKANKLIAKDKYTTADKKSILDALDALGLKKSDEAKFAILRQNRGEFIKRPKTGPPQIVADGRSDWIGWVELQVEAVNEVATRMTAKVIGEVNPDVLAVVEVEDRPALLRFSKQLLEPIPFDFHATMLIDGNDDRGIDVGIYLKKGFEIASICSHVDDADTSGNLIFSRDCPEYTIRDASGGGSKKFLLLINHLKSKGFGSQAANDARRKAQAKRVREIYDQRRADGVKLIAIAGDFNDSPDSDALSPLLGNGSDLKDIFDHPNFVGDGRDGTFANGTKSDKIDYILFSPELFAKVTGGGVFRKGVWGGTNGTLFPHFPEITKKAEAASDHAAVFADLTL